jgi:hypothetical protein
VMMSRGHEAPAAGHSAVDDVLVGAHGYPVFPVRGESPGKLETLIALRRVLTAPDAAPCLS